ncbi:replication initiation protein [Tenacibaculum finnmarkense]|uniref:replication initiation protein n=1 Tax=Tenacibaculum finnmarkense TaxID=2781243 RepID=UPI001EFAD9FA|nr:replication initiation protein [Tenacibaculum finnmarkense]MCG8208162.1 replication initiation protein [Tenacibaculum finnmarkense genomovar finnmarkense]MCG8724164.1 replication initiation protein [Tenacibaculum finnmarkense]MCG8765872.1 replication initiation protein [Tenacibaculum finnmarkense]MCG8778811.1 replication initiation protein [Tenacibaculum finnmarkense]MCM8907293.1 replication initiation protein [Tenacibaculum finnmarkense genomovar finnmarkense]
MDLKKIKVLQPLRFVDARYNFTAIQQDFIMLVQACVNRNRNNAVKNDFKIDLKPYFKLKGISLEDIRSSHYRAICEDLIKASIGFQYFKTDTLFTFYSLFKSCSVTVDLFLEVSIIDDVLPLFYIKKLKEGHFQNNKLVKRLFDEKNTEFDKYISYLPETYIQFKKSSTKRLFQKLLQYRSLGKRTFNFTKDELYLLLGYGEYVLIDDQENVFKIKEYKFVQTKFEGVNGWKNVSKNLKIWLQEIHENEDSEIKISLQNKKLFKITGRPVRDIQINVVYDDIKGNLTEEQSKMYIYLQRYKLSPKQRYSIIKNYNNDEILAKLKEYIISMSNARKEQYFGEYKRQDYRKISNIAGYVYTLFSKKTV